VPVTRVTSTFFFL